MEALQVILDLGMTGDLHKEASTRAAVSYFNTVLSDPSLSEECREKVRLAYLQVLGGKRALIITKQKLKELEERGLGLQVGKDDELIECDSEEEADAMLAKIQSEGSYPMVGRIKSQDP